MSLKAISLLGLIVPVITSYHGTSALSLTVGDSLKSYQIYSTFPPNNLSIFNHMVFDERGNRIFAGAVNKLFHLDPDLNLKEEVKTGPKLDSPLCHARGCDLPEIETFPTNNVNKILVVDPESQSLIVCGSVLQGACEKYNTSSILIPPKFVSLSIAANDETSSTYAFIGPENYDSKNKNNILYVGTTFTNHGEYRHDVPAISSRKLYDLEFAAFSFSKQSLLRIDVKYRDQFLVKYVYGFNSTDFAYFVIVQKESHLPGQEEKGYVSRLARTCISDENYDSYTEVTLQCTIRNEETNKLVNYNLIQDAKIGAAGAELAASLGINMGENILVGIFSPSKGITNEALSRSAVCVYSLQEIEAKFTENIHMCFNGSISDRNLGYVSGLILDGKCPAAGSAGNIPYFCEVGLKISGVIPVKTRASLHFPNATLTSVTLAKTEKHTVAFLGTKNGYIKKVLLSGQPVEYESVVIDEGFPILPDTVVSPKGDFLYVLSTSKITKLKIEHCGSYTNCSACLEAQDPYCGWCSLEKRCTVRRTCQLANHGSPRWLSISGGQQCIDFEYVYPDKIPISEMTMVQLTIKTLPELPSGAKYRCVFGTSDPIDASVSPSGLTCLTPKIAGRPPIPDNSDHLLVPLAVRSSETNKDFVSRNFIYYDCGRHLTCRNCVVSQWPCNWCIYENKCIHNGTTCQRIGAVTSNKKIPVHAVVENVDDCPRFRNTNQTIFLPNKVSKEIILDVVNIPHPQFVHLGFLCIVNIEGAKMMIPARVEKSRFIICDKTVYSYEASSGEYKANVTVVWNKNHHVDTTVIILYKCDVLGSHRDHPDCSLCLTSHPKYDCTWCGSSCSYKDSCRHLPLTECPKPRIDVVKPLSGPVEGGTLVTIEGSNLGLREEDVKGKIRIGNTTCELVYYEISVKIVCRTGPSLAGESIAPISVGNKAGYTESSVRFSYKTIHLEELYPTIGPHSGGTQLAISGQHLNIGSAISVTLDELPCNINSTQATSTRLTCVTTRSKTPRIIRKLILTIDGANRTLEENPFNYTRDPTIMEIRPLKSFVSGGRMMTVHGTNLNVIQKPEMFISLEDEPNAGNKSVNKCDFDICRGKSDFLFINVQTKPFHYSALHVSMCTVISSFQIECPSPSINIKLFTRSLVDGKTEKRFSLKSKRSLKYQEIQLTAQVGFLMDDVESVKDLRKHFRNLRSQLLYVSDPVFFRFANMIKSYKGDTLVIEGENLNLASDETDVKVTIGTVACNVTSLALTQLVCVPPEIQPEPTDELGFRTNNGLPLVVVRVGTILRFSIGYLKYEVIKPNSIPQEAIIGITVGACLLVIAFLIILVVFRRKSTQAEREYKRIQIQMDTLESNVRSECKLAFAELQTDITDLTADLESTGIPTLDHRSYVMKVFFPGVTDHPILNNPQMRTGVPRTNYDAAMFQFEQLINNKHFILTFIDTLESQKTFNIRDKVSVASLVMVVLMGKMEYATDVLRSLLLRLIDKSVKTKYPQLMLRRTESVVEKMLTNWMALCMYSYLKDYAGSSLFLLFKAIKHQVEKGPVDAFTHDARYSLSEERLLKEQIEHEIVTLHIVQDELDEKIQCKVLDCDTISQVKSKILDALFKNTHYSLRPSIHEMDLEWRHGRGGHLTLQDEDLTTKSIAGWKKINTLAHYGIKASAVMSLIPRQHEVYCKQPCRNCSAAYFSDPSGSVIPGNNDADARTQSKIYHLVKQIDDHQFTSKTGSTERSHKAIPEIFLTRLLSTKGTVQKYVDDFFLTILTADDSLPAAVKWVFDLLDEAAKRHSISDPEIVHSWKSNSLPLRFWVNFIKNPDFIFDINKTATVDSCLSVIAQTFMDACSTTEHRLGKDSPSNKLLFAKDIPQYRDLVMRFYRDVQSLPQITGQEMNTAMQQLSTSQEGEFDVIAALKELYIYVARYSGQVIEALETDPTCKKMHLAHKLENVACTLEGEETSTC